MVDKMQDFLISDETAESLENAGLFRRAATRWLNVLSRCSSLAEWEWVSQRRSVCLKKARYCRKK